MFGRETDLESIISLSVSFAGGMHRPRGEPGNFARSHNDTLRNFLRCRLPPTRCLHYTAFEVAEILPQLL